MNTIKNIFPDLSNFLRRVQSPGQQRSGSTAAQNDSSTLQDQHSNTGTQTPQRLDWYQATHGSDQ